MRQFNQREQSLIDALNSRLVEADTLQAKGILKEIEASDEYTSPGHPDHFAYLHMVPLVLGKQMTLAGLDPLASGTDPDSSMLDNQRFTHDVFPEEKELDFSEDNREYESKRSNAVNYLNQVRDDKDLKDREIHIEAAQKQLLEIDQDYAHYVESRDAELKYMEDREIEWAEEEVKRSAQMKEDFMTTRLKGVLKPDIAQVTELAEQEWEKLQSAYGF